MGVGVGFELPILRIEPTTGGVREVGMIPVEMECGPAGTH